VFAAATAASKLAVRAALASATGCPSFALASTLEVTDQVGSFEEIAAAVRAQPHLAEVAADADVARVVVAAAAGSVETRSPVSAARIRAYSASEYLTSVATDRRATLSSSQALRDLRALHRQEGRLWQPDLLQVEHHWQTGLISQVFQLFQLLKTPPSLEAL
jgi:hypothetical protein